MRILIVAGLAGPNQAAGGVWTVAWTQKRILEARGHDVRIVGGWLGASPPETDPNTYLIPVAQRIPRGGLRFLYGPEFVNCARQLAEQSDIAHIHLARDYVTTATLRAISTATVVQAHGMISPAAKVSTRIFDALNRRTYLRRARTWLALTSAEVASLNDYGVDDSKIERVQNAVAEVPPYSYAAPKNARFGYISRFHARKHPEVFVNAAREVLREIRAEFVMAGPDQGEEQAVRNLVNDFGLSDSVEFLGALGPDEVARTLDGLTALVLPSRGEIAPMIAIEASTRGVPLILTNDCGLADLYVEHDAAAVVEPTQDGVASAMKLIVNDPAYAKTLSENSYNLATSEWGSDALGSRLEAIYDSILNPAL